MILLLLLLVVAAFGLGVFVGYEFKPATKVTPITSSPTAPDKVSAKPPKTEVMPNDITEIAKKLAAET
jgi:hypothetical protein